MQTIETAYAVRNTVTGNWLCYQDMSYLGWNSTKEFGDCMLFCTIDDAHSAAMSAQYAYKDLVNDETFLTEYEIVVIKPYETLNEKFH